MNTGGPYTQIVDGYVLSAAPPAQRIGGQTIRCAAVTIRLTDPVATDFTFAHEDQMPTSHSVMAYSKFPEAIPIGSQVTIAQRLDGRWTILAWYALPDFE